jgi:hypothetical protein
MKYFINSFPFVNQRMEGQLCYDFPNPSKKFAQIMKEDFSSYIDEEMFSVEEVVKYKCLSIAEKNEDKKMINDIKNKISLDELYNEFKFQEDEFKKKIDSLLEKSPSIELKTWNEILDDLSH